MNELISVEKVAQWQKLKTVVLDSVSSPLTKRMYNMALGEFIASDLVRAWRNDPIALAEIGAT